VLEHLLRLSRKESWDPAASKAEKVNQNTKPNNIVCIIPARAGSKGLPGKHMKRINEEPVISYAIEAARAVSILGRVLVSTDDSEIIDYCNENEIEAIKRPEKFATDTSSAADALIHVVKVLEEECNVDIVVWLQANVPIRKPEHITEMLLKLDESKADSVISLSKYSGPIEKALRLTDENVCVSCWSERPKGMNRQSYPNSYYPNGSICVITRSALMQKKRQSDPYDYFLGARVLGYVMEEPQYGIEINDFRDLQLCRFYMSAQFTQY